MDQRYMHTEKRSAITSSTGKARMPCDSTSEREVVKTSTIDAGRPMATAAGLEEGGVMETNVMEVAPTFEDMGLSEELLRGVFAHGFADPSDIQQRAVVPMASGRDLVAQAQSGTGKTGAFTIGMLQRLNPRLRHVQAVVLAPTREVAKQNCDVAAEVGQFMGVRARLLVGGTSVAADMKALRNGEVHVAAGTPGRILDLCERGTLDLSRVCVLVVDEADQMLEHGFRDQLRGVLEKLPEEAQVALFSATMPEEMLELTRLFLRSPARILVKREALTLQGLSQYHVELAEDSDKLETLCDLYDSLMIAQAVVFVSTCRRATWLAEELRARDFSVSLLHSGLEPAERTEVMAAFRSGAARVLIATDLVARGVNVQQVSLVLNYDLPDSRENYLHRIGRSARFGRKGVAINFVSTRRMWQLRELEEHYSTHIPALPADVGRLV